MKKLLVFLTFFVFLIISQMQLVHAVDMMSMTMSLEHHRENEVSIFCETSTDTRDNQCAKELIPDIALFEKNYTENATLPIFSLPFSHFLEYQSKNTSTIVPIGDPPNNIYQRSGYINMIGIMKSLE